MSFHILFLVCCWIILAMHDLVFVEFMILVFYLSTKQSNHASGVWHMSSLLKICARRNCYISLWWQGQYRGNSLSLFSWLRCLEHVHEQMYSIWTSNASLKVASWFQILWPYLFVVDSFVHYLKILSSLFLTWATYMAASSCRL